MKKSHYLASAACLFVTMWSGSAVAQESEPAATSEGGLSEIVVTATRRETNVQDVPAAISAIGGDGLRDAGIVDPRQLSSLAPSLIVDQGLSNGQTHVSIRGIASTDFSLGSASPVAIYLDDVYQPFQYGIGTQIFDLNRIEVLRGPQGTLFGKNTTGGALAYYSQTPVNQEEGYFVIDAGGGDYGHYAVEGAYNMPLGDTFAMRASFRADRRDAYVDNLFDGSELGESTTYNGRLQFRWTPTDRTTINLKLFGVKSDGDGPVYIGMYRGGQCASATAFNVFNRCTVADDDSTAAPDSPSSRQTNSEVPITDVFSSYGATLRLDQEIGSATLTSITGWQRSKNLNRSNTDSVSGDLFHSRLSSNATQISQELRIATDVAKPLRTVVGVFGSYDRITADQGSGSTTLPPFLGFDYYQGSLSRQKTDSFAAFGSVTYDLTEQFSVVAGLRYSIERKRNRTNVANFFGFNPVTFATRDLTDEDLSYAVITSRFATDPNFGDTATTFNVRDTFKRLTWDVTANFKPSEDLLLFAKVATGFRSGGFPVGTTSTTFFTALQPEKVTAYEVGFKSEWLGNSLRINGGAYLMDYKDQQVQQSNPNGPGLILSNAASSRIKGAELEVEVAPGGGFNFHGSVGYTDAKYRDYLAPVPGVGTFQLEGNRLPYAAKWTAAFGGSLEVPVGNLKLTLANDWTYRSRIYFDSFNLAAVSDRPQLIGDARLSIGDEDDAWKLTAYVQNLTNRDIKVFAFDIGYVTPTVYAPKRTWGLRADFAF